MRFGMILLSSVLLLAGCTVIPKWGAPRVASWDGNEQNSGLLGQLPDRSGVITDHAKARYVVLCGQYGGKFAPPVLGNEGLTVWSNAPAGPVWRIDAEHLAKFGDMSRWKREGVK